MCVCVLVSVWFQHCLSHSASRATYLPFIYYLFLHSLTYSGKAHVHVAAPLASFLHVYIHIHIHSYRIWGFISWTDKLHTDFPFHVSDRGITTNSHHYSPSLPTTLSNKSIWNAMLSHLIIAFGFESAYVSWGHYSVYPVSFRHPCTCTHTWFSHFKYKKY